MDKKQNRVESFLMNKVLSKALAIFLYVRLILNFFVLGAREI